MPPAYPMMLDVADRLVVIVGGGAVAARKAAGLIECGATRVRCVAPVFDAAMPASVERVAARYEKNHLDGAGLVFAATDNPAVNDAVVHDAHARGLLVNRADPDEQTPGDFATPARWRHGPVTVTVSAGGSPALAVRIRDGLAARWDSRWSNMADAMAALRPALLATPGLDAGTRARVFRDLATDEALAVLDVGTVEDVYDWLRRRHPTLPASIAAART
jgi:siroheme synthase-like protein